VSENGAILVIRLSSLGDVLLCAPGIRALKRRFPRYRVDFLVAKTYREAAEMLPGVDQIIEFDKQTGWRGLFRLRRLLSRRYDVIVDLQNSWRSAFLRHFCFPMMWVKANRYRFRRWVLIRLKRNLYGAPKHVPDRYVEALDVLGATDDDDGLRLVSPIAEATHESKSVVLCPGSRHMTKQWPVERWRELREMLTKDGWNACVCGSQEEKSLVETVANGSSALIGASLHEVAKKMKTSRLVVSHDSGLMHLAAGLDVPLIAIFGPTVEQFGFYPYRAKSAVIEQQLACRPCSAFGGDRCPKGHHDCMMKTRVDDVMRSIRKLLT
jgi:heptosyltransferase-2